MKRKLEEMIYENNTKEYTAVRPPVYQERFMKTVKKIFQ